MMGLPLPTTPETAWSEVWAAVLDRLRVECGQGIFDTWIAPLSLSKASEGQVCLSAPRRLVRDYVASHYAARLERAFTALADHWRRLTPAPAAAKSQRRSGP